jgi:hypothetical protein
MRLLCIVTLLVLWSSASAGPVPDLTCQEARYVRVDPRSLAVQERTSQTIYRFKSGSLYLTPTDRGEYLYGKVVEVEPMRYSSGHKVIQFEGNGSPFLTAVLVHTYRDEVRVSRASCRRP